MNRLSKLFHVLFFVFTSTTILSCCVGTRSVKDYEDRRTEDRDNGRQNRNYPSNDDEFWN